MPVYEYECQEHGEFETLRSLAEYALPAPCPTCDADSARIMSVPHLAGVPRATMVAHDRNEQSRYEPRLSRTACGSDHNHAPKAKPQRVPGQRPALQNYSGKRPWVMEHG